MRLVVDTDNRSGLKLAAWRPDRGRRFDKRGPESGGRSASAIMRVPDGSAVAQRERRRRPIGAAVPKPGIARLPGSGPGSDRSQLAAARVLLEMPISCLTELSRQDSPPLPA